MDIVELDKMSETTAEYQLFVDKFKPKKTTDDCYTPPLVYEATKDWAVKEYGLQDARIVRPFYPGGDYTAEDYSGDCVVIDNPPFSIVSKITSWYREREIKFFLFAPALTLFNVCRGKAKYVICGEPITYANGATVATSFVTNLGHCKIWIAASLTLAIRTANIKTQQQLKPDQRLLHYDYPDNVITAARVQKLARAGVELKINDGHFITRLDCQKEKKKSIYGAGFLIADESATKVAAASKAVAAAKTATWSLSAGERMIVDALDRGRFNEPKR